MGFLDCEIPDGQLITPTPESLLDSPSISLSNPAPSTSTGIASPVAKVTSSATTDRMKDLSRGQEAAIGTAIPVGVIALVVLAIFLWQRVKKQRAKRILGQTDQEEKTEDHPPFLQSKPELQGEDSRHEMPAEDLRFELDEDNTRHEIMTEEHGSMMIIQAQQQELRGEEFALELDDYEIRAER